MPAIMAKRSARKSRRRKPTRSAGKRASRTPGKLPKEAVTLIVQLKARDGQELLLEAELRALITPTRKEEGCIVYELLRSADAPGRFLFYEVWASREAHTAHTRTQHFLRWSARKDVLAASRDSSFWKKIL
jgi:quinol monooxygenase YgiN